MESPKTQSIDAVKALLSWKGRAIDSLPEFVEIGKEDNRLILVLSNKKDFYYVVTPKTCSCPSAAYRPGKVCKHQRRYFSELFAKPATEEKASLRSDLPGWPGGYNVPVKA